MVIIVFTTDQSDIAGVFINLQSQTLFSNCYLSFTGEKCTSMVEVGRKEMFYLTTHSTHFIYGYMASDIS